MPGTVQFIVGNTYHRLPNLNAPWSKGGNVRKVHDVTVYVDVLGESFPEILNQVTFDLSPSFHPRQFTHSTPVPIERSNGTRAWRFATRQQVYGAFTAHITLRGDGGSTLETSHIVQFVRDTNSLPFKMNVQTFKESRPARPLQMTKLSDQAKFGIELEMSTPPHITPQDITTRLYNADIDIYNSTHSYMEGRIHSEDSWKLVPDGSILCHIHEPDCHKFELVSPPLKSGAGLSQIHTILKTLDQNYRLMVNKSMGFHVHVDASQYSLDQLIRICQQFCKYEPVMDTFMPQSRRTGSEHSDKYFQSNAQVIESSSSWSSSHDGIWTVHNRLGRCTDLESLADVMNAGNSRYYKLNLQNLKTGRQPTLEFRQHSSTTDYHKVSAWVRFCLRFCENAAKLKAPTPFKRGKSMEEKFDALFYYVIKDRALHKYYKNRRSVLGYGDEHEDACCTGCVLGRGCSSNQSDDDDHDDVTIRMRSSSRKCSN